MKLVGGLVPSLHLSGGHALEGCLLLLDLLADGFDIRFDLRFELIPMGLQLLLCALPGGFARIRLLLQYDLKLVAALFQI